MVAWLWERNQSLQPRIRLWISVYLPKSSLTRPTEAVEAAGEGWCGCIHALDLARGVGWKPADGLPVVSPAVPPSEVVLPVPSRVKSGGDLDGNDIALKRDAAGIVQIEQQARSDSVRFDGQAVDVNIHGLP